MALALIALTAFFAYWIRDFRLDASGDQLVLEHDADLRYYRQVVARYESGDFVFVTYTPPGDLFSSASLERLKLLRGELRALKRVSSVITILDVPLLKNPPVAIKDLKDNIKTLESPDADMKLAIAEFRGSELYQNLLVSPDLKSTAIQVNFRADPDFEKLFSRRSELHEKEYEEKLTDGEAAELHEVEADYRRVNDRVRRERHEDIAAIREIIGRYREEGRLYLGGVPMIVDDIITFIKNDLRDFGLGMLCFLILTLGVIFNKLRWVVLPMLSCVVSVVVMMGLLGLSGWDVTVVSSNFISLQLIFTMSIAIHIVVRYRELVRRSPDEDNRVLVRDAVRLTFVPCLYATLTTIAGFASLVLSDILPVVNFGWMMTMGLAVSLAVTFVLLPAGMMLLPKPPPVQEKPFGVSLVSFFARAAEKRGLTIYTGALIVAVLTAVGTSRLEVENSFIDYFKKSTDIYQGMKFIDQHMGGTTPLDIILDLKSEKKKASPLPAVKDDDFDMFGEFEEEEGDPSKYWFTRSRLETISKVHDYIESLPATGKVLSLATLWDMAKDLNSGKPFDDFTLTLLFNSMPDRFQGILIDPYVNVDQDQARVTTRIKDSMRTLRRDALIKQIRRDMTEKLGIPPDRFRVSGLMVLYNNMLQSLFRSQIRTIGFTLAALAVMFLLLFRSVKVSLIALFPNVLSSMTVLGVMGLAGIPLDVMTITIVAISVGIAVDDTIHYLHRFEGELALDGDYLKAMHRCHASIGNAMFYTSLTITVGFSILAFSNFVPTILFGLMTALAMTAALVGALALLPRLIMLIKPFGPGKA